MLCRSPAKFKGATTQRPPTTQALYLSPPSQAKYPLHRFALKRPSHGSSSPGNNSVRAPSANDDPALRRPDLAPRLSPSPPQRSGRRLPRHQRRRSLPLARRHRFRRNQGLGGGREQANLPLPRPDSLPPGHPRPPHQALELRTLHRSRTGRRPLLLPAQQRTPEPERTSRRGVAQSPSPASCSIPTRSRAMARSR